MFGIRSTTLFCLVSATLVTNAKAGIIVTTAKSDTAPTVSGIDLAQTNFLGSSATGGNEVASQHAQLFNGSIGNTDGDTADLSEVTMNNGNTFTVNLDISSNALGYDISRIDTYFGWSPSSGGRSNQGYSIILTYVDDSTATLVGPTHWEPNAPASYWTTVSFEQDGLGTLQSDTVNLNGGGAIAGSNVIASGVKSITFDISNNANAGGVIVGREIDIFGVATVPEPNTIILAIISILSVVGLVFVTRTRNKCEKLS